MDFWAWYLDLLLPEEFKNLSFSSKPLLIYNLKGFLYFSVSTPHFIRVPTISKNDMVKS